MKKTPTFSVKYELYRLTYLPETKGAEATLLFTAKGNISYPSIERQMSFFSSDLPLLAENDVREKNNTWIREIDKKRLRTTKLEVYADGMTAYEVRVSSPDLKSNILVTGYFDLPKEEVEKLAARVVNYLD